MLSLYQDNLIGGVIIKQIIVRLQDEIHQSLKIKAIKDGVSVQNFVENIVKEYVNSNLTATEFIAKLKK